MSVRRTGHLTSAPVAALAVLAVVEAALAVQAPRSSGAEWPCAATARP